ncbi:MAG: type II toxin-antitoxin system RelE/ParE family toxin [Tabrizicola flagellatus]|uniref:type II toxin-antitoxin system RelE/ParE family toxin n=1 Tax=Tabrizicola flagellatus TaxID=2593021 RepID=UPI00391B20E9
MTWRIRFHPRVARDLASIVQWILDYAGPDVAARKLAEIEATIATLKDTPHKGSLRDDIAPGLRAIPAGRKAVIAFVVDDAAAEVLIYAVTYGGADWAQRSMRRRKERR